MRTLNQPKNSPQSLIKMQGASSILSNSSVGDVGVLVGLGLSVRQARVYLALLRAGVAGVQVVSDLSGVHRQEVYRVLDVLGQLGLVQKNVTNPVSFTVTPIGEAVKLLLGQKNCELDAVAKKAELLTKKFSNSSVSQMSLTLKPCFGTIVEADRGKRYQQTIKSTRQAIWVVSSWRRFKQLSIHFETQLLGALRRGVIVHVVTEKPERQVLPKWVATARLRHAGFELRTMQVSPAAAIAVFDHAQAAIAYNPNISLTKGPELWTDCSALTVLVQAYFEAVWVKASVLEVVEQ
ncbi:MAG: TrmB family transcriptional regulator [Candidatus Bathyarchaeia archaeon]|jgi:sugar-specific transcriptional regulator TrmB